MTISYVDIGIIITILFFTWKGLRNGFLAELASLFGLLIGFYLARIYAEPLSIQALEYTTYFTNKTLFFICFVAIILGTMLVAIIIAKLLKMLLNVILIGWMDYVLGAAFGLLKGSIIVCIIVNVIDTILNQKTLENSIFFPYYDALVTLLYSFFQQS